MSEQDVDAVEEESTPSDSIGAELFGAPMQEAFGQQVIFPSMDTYIDVMTAAFQDGYSLIIDLCGVDYLDSPHGGLPSGVDAERFEIVVSLLKMNTRERLRARLQVADGEMVPTLFDVWPGTEAMEREAYDMFGIEFDNHPDMSRILMPDDWNGHPLRKDFAIGSIPVQFKEGGSQ